MKVTHVDTYNGLKYHFDGDSWFYFSPTYNKWVTASLVIPSKLKEVLRSGE